MKFTFADQKLEALYKRGEGAGKYSPEVCRRFMKVMQFIRMATDERDLRSLRGLRFEKLHRGDYSMRLNDQFRLTFMIEGTEITIHKVEDYH